MSDSEITKRPEWGGEDAAYAVVRGALGGLPFVSGVAVEFFTLAIAPPLEARRDEWIESIARLVTRLQKQVERLRLEDLAKKEGFTTAFLYASQIALRTHLKEKIEALRNAVLNSAMLEAPDDSLQVTFLNFIDVFTPAHLRVLRFTGDHNRWNQGDWEKSLSLEGDDLPKAKEAVAREYGLPDKQTQPDFCELVASDLFSRALIEFPLRDHRGDFQFSAITDGEAVLTPLGQEFLKFITSPIRGDKAKDS